MDLYTVVGSPNCRKVEAVVNRLGVKVNRHYLDFFEGDHFKPEHLARNPNGKVPCLKDGSLVLWESNAINTYLCDSQGGEKLLPKDAVGRADVMRWLCWELAHFNRAFGTLVFENVIKPNFKMGEGSPELISAAVQELNRFASVLDRHMQGRTFVSGDNVTIADYAIIHLEGFRDLVAFDWAPFGALNGYVQRMREDAAWASTAPANPQAMGRKPKAA